MKDGKVVEEGKFDELIRKNGVFSDFYRLQNKEN